MATLLEMRHISKSFPGVRALDNVSISIEAGTVHAVMGENGAGKSTLMKVLFGMYQPDEGEIIFNGIKQVIRSTKQALALGISMIFQELSPIKDLSIAENIFMGRYPMKCRGVVDWAETYAQTQALLAHWGMKYDPRQKMRTLKMADMQMIEIVKAISFQTKLIIMDEPTSAITETEVQKLFSFMRELKAQGITIVMITHKLDEVFKIADAITVLRDGHFIGEKPISDITREQMVTMMVGREITNMFPQHKATHSDTLLEVHNLQNGASVQGVSFSLNRGEILGFAGIMGAGRTETLRCVFGLDSPQAGEIYLDGARISVRCVRDAISNGIMMATESRKDDGLVLCRSIRENMALPSLYKTSRLGIISKREEKKTTQAYSEQLRVKTPNLEVRANSLSGGNQQKVVLAKWLMMHPKVLILDEPTRGIDIGAKSEIYHMITQLAAQGVGIIFISSDMEEVIGISDRVLVMCEGKISGVLEKADITQEKIMELASEVAV